MATAVPATAESGVSVISVSGQVSQAAGAAVLSPFVSFSIEFSSFPDFAGTSASELRGYCDKLADRSYRKLIPSEYIYKKLAG